MDGHAGNLAGIRVLDCTGEIGFLAGKLLAELGADVIKIEPPGGDPARRRGPFVGGTGDPEHSVLWLALNTSKRGITLDLEDPAGRTVFFDLCRQADVLLCSGQPGEAGGVLHSRFPESELRAANPRLTVCRISPFGSEGPYADRRGSDLTILALGGNLYATGNPDRAPVRCSLPVSHSHGSIEAAAGVVFALCGREFRGVAQTVDISIQEALGMANMTTPTQFPLTGFRGKRVGGGFRGARAFFRELWPCRDGYVSFSLRGGPARIPGLVALVRYMDEAGQAPPAVRDRDWTRYNHNTITQPEVDEIEAALEEFFRGRTMQELFVAACDRNLMLAPANTAREILASRQLAAREFFVEVPDPARGITLRYPGPFARSSLGGIAVRGPAPRLGQHDEEVREESAQPLSDAVAATGAPQPSSGPRGAHLFDGLRVLEFGGGAAGPFGTRYFADHGAMVVRVESRQRPDFIRLLRYTPGDPAGLDGSHMFAMVNVNKFGIALNMNHPRAVEVARRLAGWCDVLAENFAPRAMAKWGLDYASLRVERPDLVMVSTCLNGQTGPDRNYPGFGGQGSALSGFNHLTGWPDREPLGPYGTITDSLAPRFVALLVASALLHRGRTGRGQYIDLSQVEAGVVCLAENMLTYTGTGELLGRDGNRSRFDAPHGVFRCAPSGDDDDRWLALAIHGDEDWLRLRRVLGEPPWATDSTLLHAAGRCAASGLLEEHLGRWTRDRDAGLLARDLVEAGLDAAVVQNFEELLADPQLKHRGHFRRVQHPVIGEHLCETNGMRFSATPGEIARPAPRLGEHTLHILRDVVGLSAAECDDLAAQGVLE